MSKPRIRLIASAGSVVIGGLVAYLALTPHAAHSPRIRNVLLISIDTCRADHLHCYGQPRHLTPRIDELAADGVLFENAIASAPLTLPSHSTLMTGAYPVDHGVHDNLDYQLSAEAVTLAELFQAEGFATGAMVSAYVLDERFGLGQGFDDYDDQFEEQRLIGNLAERGGGEAAKRAVTWLREHRDDRFFYFLHFFDPHHEYEPPEPFATEYADDLYAGEIAYTDQCIGQVLEELKKLELYDDTLIILVGDHGEMLGEHGELGHSYYIYQGAVRVPLIFKLPRDYPADAARGRSAEQLAGLVDVTPTVCRLLDLPCPPHLPGLDLSPYVVGDPPTVERYVYCESLTPTKYQANSLIGLVGEQWKLIQTTRPELYHLPSDPREQDNRIDSDPQQAQRMQDELTDCLRQSLAGANRSAGAIDQESRRKLESLGYVGGATVEEDFSFDVSKPDPKDAIELHHAYDGVQKLIFADDLQGAKEKCASILAAHPQLFLFNYAIGQVCNRLGEFAEAAMHLEAAIKQQPDSTEAHFELGRAERGRGALDRSQESLRRAIELNADFAEAHAELGVTLAMAGDPHAAIASYERALSIHPNAAGVHNNLGAALASIDRFEEAIDHYTTALDLRPDYVEALANLAIVQVRQGDLAAARDNLQRAASAGGENVAVIVQYAELLERVGQTGPALAQYRAAVRLAPENPQLHYKLAMLLKAEGQLDNALVHLQEHARLAPQSHAAHYNLANFLAEQQRFDEAIEFFTEAIRLNPGHAGSYVNLGNALASSARYEAAVTRFKEALALAPDSILAHYNLALCYVALEQWANAAESYEQAIRLEPGHVDALNGAAWILATHRDPTIRDIDRAVVLAERAADATGRRNPAILDTLATAYAAVGDFDRAVGILEQALRLLPAEPASPLRRELESHRDQFKSSAPILTGESPEG